MADEIVIENTIGDLMETGLWCPSCALPSAVRVEVLWFERDTLKLAFTSTVVVCEECCTQVEEP